MTGGDAGAPDTSADGHAAIFLSYARDDQKRALPIVELLKAAGFTIWWDGMIAGGDRFLPTTETALENAKAVLVLWSARSVESHWVRDEATRGRDRGCIVPLSLDGTAPPLGFRQFQTIDFSNWRGRSTAPEWARMIDAVARLCDRAPVVAAVQRPAVGHTSFAGLSRRSVMIGGGASLVALGGLAAWTTGLLGGNGPQTNSVAVLPFENLGQDRDRDYFAEGLSAELRSALSRNTALTVAAQTSSDAARQLQLDARHIAQRLGVAFLLDGNVRIANNMVRVAAELTEGRTGLVKWSKSFERAMGDILTVQSEIAGAVTAALTSVMVSSSGNAAPLGGTANVAAYDAYLRGRDLYNRAADEAGERAALSRFDAALALDPRFAAAHAARARSLTVIANQYGNEQEVARYGDAALAAAQRAVDLAPTFADAQSTLGAVLFQARLEVARARDPYDRSYQLGSGDATVIGRFGLYCANTGREADALAAVTRSVELDPLNPLAQIALGFVHYAARRYGAVIAPIEAALAQAPDLDNSSSIAASARYMMGDLTAARRAFVAESNPLYRETGLAIVERRAGNMAAALAARARVVDGLGTGQLTLYQQAQIAAQWGEVDHAAALLAAAYAARDSGLIYLRIDPMLDPARQHPDFIRLLRSLGFS